MTTTLSTGLFREPCRYCHLIHTLGRDQDNLPLCQRCARLQEAGDILAAFAQAVYQSINQEVLIPNDMLIHPICGHPYLTKLTPDMGKAEILDLTNYVCPACAQEIAEFEWACETEYQASKKGTN